MIMTSNIFVRIPNYSDQHMRTNTSFHIQDVQVESKEDRSSTPSDAAGPHNAVRREHSTQEKALHCVNSGGEKPQNWG